MRVRVCLCVRARLCVCARVCMRACVSDVSNKHQVRCLTHVEFMCLSKESFVAMLNHQVDFKVSVFKYMLTYQTEVTGWARVRLKLRLAQQLKLMGRRHAVREVFTPMHCNTELDDLFDQAPWPVKAWMRMTGSAPPVNDVDVEVVVKPIETFDDVFNDLRTEPQNRSIREDDGAKVGMMNGGQKHRHIDNFEIGSDVISRSMSTSAANEVRGRVQQRIRVQEELMKQMDELQYQN